LPDVMEHPKDGKPLKRQKTERPLPQSVNTHSREIAFRNRDKNELWMQKF